MTTIVTCHGHGASSDSFNFIKYHLEGFDIVDLEYDSSYGFESNLLALSEQVASISGKVVFIGHSLGGIYCAHLAMLFPEKTLGGITLATPWGGSAPAMLLGLVWPARVLKDITPTSEPIYSLRNKTLPGDWWSLVTVKGHSRWILGDNDGVVSKASMTFRDDVDYIETKTSHLGVLLNFSVVETILGVLILIEKEM